jgi:hypothetical protein
VLDEWGFLTVAGELLAGEPNAFEVLGLPEALDFGVEFLPAAGGGFRGRLQALALPEPSTGVLLLVGLLLAGRKSPRQNGPARLLVRGRSVKCWASTPPCKGRIANPGRISA